MTAAKPVIGLRGLKRSGNPLAFQPGALELAQNCVIKSKDVVMPRRGQRLDTARYVDDDDTDANANRASELFQWGNHLVIHYEGDAGGGMSIYEDFLTTSTVTLLEASERPYPDLLRMKFASMVGSLYWTTDEGVKTLDEPSGNERISGIPPPGDFYTDETAGQGTRLSGNPEATGSWMPADSAAGYKATLGLVDAHGVVRESAPNGRIVVVNPEGLTFAPSAIIRSGGVTVTCFLSTQHAFRVGDVFALSPGEANFAAGNKTVTAVTSTTIVYSEAGVDVANTVEQTISSGTKKTSLVFALPPGLTTNHFIRVYRTLESAGADLDPGNEHQLCIERLLSSSEVSNRSVTLSDTTPADFLGEDLYTNPNGADGPLSANSRPPLAADVCTFDGRLWYGKTKDQQRLTLRLLGCGSPDGIQHGDVLAINDRFYRFDSAGSGGPKVFTEHTPSRNIECTLTSLVKNYNEDLGGFADIGVPQTAVRVITDADTPAGKILIEHLYLAADAMHAATSRQSAWLDALPLVKVVDNANSERVSNVVTVKTTTAHGFSAGQQIRLACDIDEDPDADFDPGVKTIATVPGVDEFTYAETGDDESFATIGRSHVVYLLTYESDEYEKPLRHSKQGEPESCPLGYTLDERLPDGADVLRIRASPQNDRLYVFLKDGDIFEVSGSYPYTVRRFDGTATLIAADSLKEHAGQLYGLTSQGVVSISDAGVQLVGVDLEDDVQNVLALMEAEDISTGDIWALSYESDRQYQLWLPRVDDEDEEALADDGAVSQAFLLSSLRSEWMGPWLGRRTCGLVFQGPRYMVLGDGQYNILRIERKDLRFTDFADESITGVTIDGPPGAPTVILSGQVFGLDYGWIVYNVTRSEYRMVSSYAAGLQIFINVLGDIATWEDGDALEFFKPIPVRIRWRPDPDGQPGLEKHWRQVQLHLKNHLTRILTASFYDDAHEDAAPPVVMTDAAYEIGTVARRLLKRRVTPPRNVRRTAALGIELELEEAFSFFELLGYSTSEEPSTERSGE